MEVELKRYTTDRSMLDIEYRGAGGAKKPSVGPKKN